MFPDRRPYNDVRAEINDGDLLLFRGRGLASRLISVAGRSTYTHAALAVWTRGVLLCCESREFAGTRAVTLSSQVARYPGQIDVFAPNPGQIYWNAPAVADWALRNAGHDYGWRALAASACLHIPGLRCFVRPDTNDASDTGTPLYCSAFVARAFRMGSGLDTVPLLADHATEPGDLSRSSFFQYRFTLEPSV